MACLRDGDLEVLGHLVLVDDLSHFEADLGLAAQGPALAPGGHGDARKGALGGGQELAALARAFLGQHGVAANDQTLARIIGRGDLGQVGLIVEEIEL